MEVGENNIKVILLDQLKANLAALGGRNFETFRFKLKGQELESNFVVSITSALFAIIVNSSKLT